MLTQEEINQIIVEINESEEVNRRAGFSRRQRIYEDGGKEFLIEALKKEFGPESLNEMRLAPINLLKKIVNKRSNLFKQSAIRTAQFGIESDQMLIDYYVEELDVNDSMDKAHRYFTLHANTIIYCIPKEDGNLILKVFPPYQYSAVPQDKDQTLPYSFILNRFIEEGQITKQDELSSPVGQQSFSMQRGTKKEKQLVDSNEVLNQEHREYIFWTNEEHFTVNEKGEQLGVAEDGSTINPIGVMPIVNLAKDRDGKFWSTQFEDTVDISLAIMKAWTDLLTIAKHQGFSILTIISQEEPKQLKIGINKAVWLKQQLEGPQPSISYVQAASPLSEYKDLIMDLLGLMLSTADLNPKEITGSNGGASFSSGFQALIETADTLEARKRDQNPLRKAEQELWQVIKRWHNYLYDQNMLSESARSLGKFSDDFGVDIQFAEVKPLESISDRINNAKELALLGLATKKDLLKIIFPELSMDSIETKLEEIKVENKANMAEVMEGLDG